jgi:hypothetical protein
MNPGIAGELDGWNVLGQFLVGRSQIPGPPTDRGTLDTAHLLQCFELRAGNPDSAAVTFFVQD